VSSVEPLVELNYNQDGCATSLFVLIYQYVKRVRALRMSFSLLLVVKAKQKVDSLVGWATPTKSAKLKAQSVKLWNSEVLYFSL